MTSARVAFYVANKGNWVDKLIAWKTNSRYSHVELICCDMWHSTSPRDLKVRRKRMNPTKGHWEYIDVQIDPIHLDDFFNETEGRKYDWLGILGFIFPFVNHSKKRYFCSEWVSEALQIPNSYKYSPQDLYRYLRSL